MTRSKIKYRILYLAGYMDEVKEQPVKADILSFIAIILAGSFLFLVFYGIQEMYFEQAGYRSDYPR